MEASPFWKPKEGRREEGFGRGWGGRRQDLNLPKASVPPEDPRASSAAQGPAEASSAGLGPAPVIFPDVAVYLRLPTDL